MHLHLQETIVSVLRAIFRDSFCGNELMSQQKALDHCLKRHNCVQNGQKQTSHVLPDNRGTNFERTFHLSRLVKTCEQVQIVWFSW